MLRHFVTAAKTSETAAPFRTKLYTAVALSRGRGKKRIGEVKECVIVFFLSLFNVVVGVVHPHSRFQTRCEDRTTRNCDVVYVCFSLIEILS